MMLIRRGLKVLKIEIPQNQPNTSGNPVSCMSSVAIKKAVYGASKNLLDSYAKIVKGLATHVTFSKKDLNQMLSCVKEAHDALQGCTDKQKRFHM